MIESFLQDSLRLSQLLITHLLPFSVWSPLPFLIVPKTHFLHGNLRVSGSVSQGTCPLALISLTSVMFSGSNLTSPDLKVFTVNRRS